MSGINQHAVHTNGFNHNGTTESFGKRVVFNGTRADPMFQIESNVQLPVLNDGEVLVKVKAATICLSDIHTVCGTRTEPTPSVLGHEACVEIVAHKRGNDYDLKPGDRCTFSIADSCGECEFCTNDLSQKCVKLFKYGHAHMSNGSGFNGCYSSHIIIRKGTKLIKLPDEISDSLASSINCALATMVNCVDNLPQNVKNRKKKALVQVFFSIFIFKMLDY
jgi:D-arabinose 1-dehydrogenase-like Zn-dependent alcohol dehydrogenase